MVYAAIVDGLRLPALTARHIGERGDLAAPGPALLTMRKDDVSAHGDASRSQRGFHSSSSRSAALLRVTRPAFTMRPSARSNRLCSACCRDFAGNEMRGPAPTTRCHGRRIFAGATFSACPTSLARPGSPAVRATAPYVETWPRGIFRTALQIASRASLLIAHDTLAAQQP